MVFIVDIDQTIAGANAPQIYLAFHNRDLGLHIPDAIIESFPYGKSLLDIPAVQAFVQANTERWKESRRKLLETPEVLLALMPMPEALQGVHSLAHVGEVCYYTARPACTQEATQAWLERYGFPNPHKVICCASIKQKMTLLTEYQSMDETITLIDDRGHTHVLQVLEILRQEDPTLIDALERRLTIIAFGASSQKLPSSSFQLVALPDWSQVHSVINLVGLGPHI